MWILDAPFLMIESILPTTSISVYILFRSALCGRVGEGTSNDEKWMFPLQHRIIQLEDFKHTNAILCTMELTCLLISSRNLVEALCGVLERGGFISFQCREHLIRNIWLDYFLLSTSLVEVGSIVGKYNCGSHELLWHTNHLYTGLSD